MFGIGGSVSASGSTTNAGGSNQSWLLNDQLTNLWGSVFGDVMAGGVPTGPGQAGWNDLQTGAFGNMGSNSAQAQLYQQMLGPNAFADQTATFNQGQQAAADLAAQALSGVMADTQAQFGSAGQAGSSRMGLAQGIAGAQAQTALNSQLAQNQMQFDMYKQQQQQQAAAGLNQLYGQDFAMGSLQQKLEQDKLNQQFQEQFGQTNAGKLAYLMNFMGGLAGLGSNWDSSSSTNSWGASASGKFGF